MREILFRGKTKHGEWGYGSYLRTTPMGSWSRGIFQFRGIHQDWIVETAMQQGGMIAIQKRYPVIPETVGQYTGLKDKNGNKVFEGDIAKFHDEAWDSCETSCGTEYGSCPVEQYAVVGFDKYNSYAPDFVKYKFNESQVDADLHENNALDFDDVLGNVEIVGNIHDNPELMEGEWQGSVDENDD